MRQTNNLNFQGKDLRSANFKNADIPDSQLLVSGTGNNTVSKGSTRTTAENQLQLALPQ